MSHFNHAANTWDSEEKISMMGELASKTREKLALSSKVDLLDVGCGTGLFSFEFIDQVKSITGIDTSEGMLEVFNNKAKGFDNIKSINIDLERDGLEMKFDLIISSMVFHHLDQPQKMLSKLASMLNEGGQIAIVDLETEDGSFHPRPKEMGVKHFGFSNEEVESWADSAKLKVSISTISTREKNGKSYAQFLAVFTR
ncbi:class I SAM-dependent methyltransferase [Bacteriovorax sp. Seq25_V]|uniref:class I SAM-dependent DNA methyltransferase n=1 Tax=Bacteriovorax sp. Seq25_V TaxID=1201288 RepID=UPI00038A14B1|nr:class I SAM-dependent methyltransferase [Bacteriovorax sp. Seq25_V]EQC47294.1 ribosomal protein L11 methyltransferase-like protein [Bacteriovorax sp. Seq25_V]